MTRQSLVEKHFPSPAVEAERDLEAAQEAALVRERIEHWLNDPFTSEFEAWLDDAERSVEPVVGEHGNMLYQTGQRDGVRLVRDHLSRLRRDIQRRE
jgi:uncharacterized protein (DUF2164 family)